MIISIDPGQSGSICYEFNEKIYAENMPATPRDLYDLLNFLMYKADGYESVTAYVERVGKYLPGNSSTAAVKFSRHCGHIEMALIALKIPYHEILPNKWMTYFIGKQKYPESMTAPQRKAKRKNLIKAKAQALYPQIKVTLKNADALGLLSYALDAN